MSETPFQTQSESRSTRLTRRVFLGGVTTAGSAAVWRFAIQPFWPGDTPREALSIQAQALSEISEWGPQSTLAGDPFNLQADGSSALWFKTAGAPLGLQVVLGSYSMETKVQAELITASLSTSNSALLLGVAGIFPVSFSIPHLPTNRLVGYFHIFPKDGSRQYATSSVDSLGFENEKYLQISSWGPPATKVKQVFNPQGDGRSAFWVQSSHDLPLGVFLALDGIPLLSNVSGSIITAGVFAALTEQIVSQAGSHTLQLVDPANRRLQAVGKFVVEQD